MSSLTDRLLKNSKIADSSMLKDSKVFGEKDQIVTDIPMINVALSGKIDGGLRPGLLTIAGLSKHFKSAYGLILAAAFQKKYPEGVVLFYDCEFGSPMSYFTAFGVDLDRVVHIPLTNVEELKFDIANQLDNLTKKDDVFILIDSIGNLASKKEAEDAIDGKSVADMTRAKQLKGLWRIVTPHLNLKDFYLVNINHTYKEIGLFPKDIVSGGTGGIYSSDNIWIVGRAQDKKTGKPLEGYKFNINVNKSRYVKESSVIPINVTFEDGVLKYSGLLDVAMEGGYVGKPKKGWYQRINPETGEFLEGEKMYHEKQLSKDKEFWDRVFETTNFAEYIEHKFRLKDMASMTVDEIETIEDDVDEV